MISGFTEVATAGTAVQLSSTGSKYTALQIIIQPLTTNEEAVAVGGSEVKAKKGAHGSTESKGIHLEKPEAKYVPQIVLEVSDVTQVWVDALKAKDGVEWVAVLA